MIFLTGFMGSGKTTVGRVLARLLDKEFVDIDDLITEKTGSSIPEIFSIVGESGFRLLERNTLFDFVKNRHHDAVVATGGGLPLDPENRALMKASGYTVYLKASLDAMEKRVADGGGRPLWSDSAAALLNERIPFYEDADFCLDADQAQSEHLASEIRALVSGVTSPVSVVLQERSYPVYIGSGIFSLLQGFLSRHARIQGLFVLADEHVLEHHQNLILGALEGLRHTIMAVPSGEQSKSCSFLNTVLKSMLATGLTRTWACMGIGGGVTGDLAGFAASIFMRGIPVIQVPTTLLAQVDSSIGGKTGINLDSGKNLAGTFHQPIFVLSDTDFLHTLPEFYLRDARSEIIKYGIIMDRELFEDLERGNSIDIQDIVRRCATDKARIVSRDEREGDLRRILNFGHTLGHALEKALNYSLSHGQAIAAGMLFASWLSHHRSVLSGNDFLRIRTLIQQEGIIPESFDLPPPDRIAKALSVDKKGEGEGIHFVLTPAIGETSVEILARSQILDAYERYVHECT